MLGVPDWYPLLVLDFEYDFGVAHQVAALSVVVCDTDPVGTDFFDA